MNATKQGTLPLPYLAKWRAHKLMTREKLAAASGVSVATILKIEHGTTPGARYSTIAKLADGLGITTDELLYHAPAAVQVAFS